MDNAAEFAVAAIQRPKKPFLKRGEGTTRRVYASRYREDAKKKREENQKRAYDREALRKTTTQQTADDDRFIDLRHPETMTFVASNTSVDLPQFERLQLDEASMTPSVPILSSQAVDNRSHVIDSTDRTSVIDGKCEVVSGIANDATEEDVKQTSEEQWLERQRLYEDQQWTEAMELLEFEQLERKIEHETKSKLEEVEKSFIRKQMPFSENPFNDHLEKPLASTISTGKMSSLSYGEREATQPILKEKTNAAEHPRMMNQRALQKLKSTKKIVQVRQRPRSAAPVEKKVKSRSVLHSDKDNVKSSHAQQQPQSAVRQKNVDKGHSEEEINFIVDSSFLDRLIEKDFHEIPAPDWNAANTDADPLFAERLRVQSMKEDLESEKKAWQQKQERAIAQFETMKEEEAKKLKRERRVLEQQSKALLKLPSKKERSEIEALEAVLETERKETRSKEARHKLTLDRFKDQIQQLQTRNTELQEEVKWYAEMQLKQNSDQIKQRSISTITEHCTKIDAVTQMSTTLDNSPTVEHGQYSEGRNRWALRLDNPFYSEVPSLVYDTSEQQRASVAINMDQLGCHGDGKRGLWEESRNQWQRREAGSRVPDTSHGHLLRSLPQPPAMETSRLNPAVFGINGSVHDSLTMQNYAFGQQPSFTQFPSSMHQPAVIAKTHSDFGFDVQRNRQSQSFPTRRFNHQPVFGSAMPLSSADCCNSPWPMTSSSMDHRVTRAGAQVLPTSLSISRAANQITEPSCPILRSTDSQTLNLVQGLNENWTSDNQIRNTSVGSSMQLFDDSIDGDRPGYSIPTASAEKATTQRPLTAQSISVKDERKPKIAKFDNGTVKHTYPEGRIVIWFGNGDVKHVHPCGRVEYFYSDLNTWQVTHSAELDVFYFDIGQVEAHKSDGSKDVVFPDGTVRAVSADGAEREASYDEVRSEIRLPKPKLPENRPE